MARPREFNTERVLEEVMNVFWHHGYERTSFAILEKKTGIKKASLCAAYGDKDELFLHALRRYQRDSFREIENHCLHHSSPKKALESWLVCAAGLGQRSRYGCFLVNTLVEEMSSKQCTKIIKNHKKKVEKLLSGLIKKGIQSSEFRASLNPAAAARYLVWIAYGAQVSARCRESPTDQKAIVRMILQALLRE